MKRKLRLTILAGIMISFGLFCLFPSCRKKGDNEDLNPGDNQTHATLIPTDSGSWWLLKGSDSTTSKLTSTGRDTFISGGNYAYFEMEDTILKTITPKFYAKNGGYYLNLIDITEGDGQYVPVIICTLEPKVGDTWTNTGQVTYNGILVDLKMEGEVISISKQLTFNGKVYKDVIETRNKLKAKPHITPTWINCGQITMNIKEGVGVVQQDLDIHILSFFQKQVSDYLLDYHIQK